MKTEADKQKSFSIVVGEYHRQDVHKIAEFMPSRNQYRLKTVSYQFFRSKNDLIAFCCKHEIELDHISETHAQRKQKAVVSEKKERKREPRKPEIASPEAQAFGLSERQLCFCKEYLSCRNATQAYKIAVPTVKNTNAAAVGGSSFLKKPEVKAYLESKGFRK